MAINEYDGPAGQINDHLADIIPSQPSQPGLDNASTDRGNDNSLQRMTSLNLRTSIGGPSLGQRDSSIVRSSSFKRKPGPATQESRKATTVPPTYPWLKEKRLRPQVQHVPGSFGSILEPHVEQSSGLASSTRNELATTTPIIVESARQQEAPHIRSSTAVESLHHVKDSGTISVRPKASLRGKGSQASLKSIASARASMKPQAEGFISRQVFQPVMAHEIEQIPSNHIVRFSIKEPTSFDSRPQKLTPKRFLILYPSALIRLISLNLTSMLKEGQRKTVMQSNILFSRRSMEPPYPNFYLSYRQSSKIKLMTSMLLKTRQKDSTMLHNWIYGLSLSESTAESYPPSRSFHNVLSRFKARDTSQKPTLLRSDFTTQNLPRK